RSLEVELVPTSHQGFAGDGMNVAWPKVCMGCGMQENLTTIDEPFNRKMAISSTKLGMQTTTRISSFSGVARISLCPNCKKEGDRDVTLQRLPGTIAVLASFLVLVFLWLPYGGITMLYGILSGLWIPVIFLGLGPLRSTSLLDSFGRINIQYRTGNIGFSFRNALYHSAFSGMNSHLQSWTWEQDTPQGYSDTKVGVNVDAGFRIISILMCPAFLFGLVLVSVAGFVGVGMSMGIPLIIGLVIMVLLQLMGKMSSDKST
ncbi:MAG: hypothetical protein ACFFE7_14855, partial [Candidatus Thorarchaeota archaeon]